MWFSANDGTQQLSSITDSDIGQNGQFVFHLLTNCAIPLFEDDDYWQFFSISSSS